MSTRDWYLRWFQYDAAYYAGRAMTYDESMTLRVLAEVLKTDCGPPPTASAVPRTVSLDLGTQKAAQTDSDTSSTAPIPSLP